MKINKTSLILATILSATANAERYYICIPCEKGEYEKDGKCTPCPAGSYSNLNSQSQCTPCPAGTYQPNKGQTNCITCPAGNACPYGSANPQYCDGKQGLWAPTGSGSCQACTGLTGYNWNASATVDLRWNVWEDHGTVCQNSGCNATCYFWPVSRASHPAWVIRDNHIEYGRRSWDQSWWCGGNHGENGHTYIRMTCNNTNGSRHLEVTKDEGGIAEVDVWQ